MKKFLISTGGSGGHVIPALNLYDHLKDNFEVQMTTDHRGKKFINQKKYNIDVFEVKNIFSNYIYLPFNTILFFISIIKAYFFLRHNKINLLISTGGYMSLPFCISAKILNIKIYLFEPNLVIGRSNKIFVRYSKKIFCYDKNIVGLPEKYQNKIILIKPILSNKILNYKKKSSLNTKTKLKLLVLGGSQGAEFFDEIIEKIVEKLSKNTKIEIVQQVHNKKKIDMLKNRYNKINISNNVFSFDDNLIDKIQDCNLAITRCGASSLAELIQIKLPFIGIPFPFAKDNHQFFNAKYYEKKNCCWLIEQKNLKIDEFSNFIKKIINEPKIYQEKIDNMIKFSNNNTWNNTNRILINFFNEC